MMDQKYIPQIKFAGNHIIMLKFSVGGKYATIENADITSPDDSFIEIPDAETYNKYHEIDDTFYEKLVNKRYLSDYPDCVLEIEEKYGTNVWLLY